jgi:hypothetical protein
MHVHLVRAHARRVDGQLEARPPDLGAPRERALPLGDRRRVAGQRAGGRQRGGAERQLRVQRAPQQQAGTVPLGSMRAYGSPS